MYDKKYEKNVGNNRKKKKNTQKVRRCGLNQQTLQTIYGCLLHDIGKVAYRTKGGNTGHVERGMDFLESILDETEKDVIINCVQFHHEGKIKKRKTEVKDVAYVTCVADTIAANIDRRTINENWRFYPWIPSISIFTHMNQNESKKKHRISLNRLDGCLYDLNYKKTAFFLTEEYRKFSKQKHVDFLAGIKNDLCSLNANSSGKLEVKEKWITPLLAILEYWTSNMPSSTLLAQSQDISLYDHVKVTAAIGSCMSEYLQTQEKKLVEENISYGELLISNNKLKSNFRAENIFLLYSADFSGIQKFIYTVGTSEALRTLRSRSFFLEILMEHYIDELISECGVCRANVLYSGGGHCYILLPNTKAVKQNIEKWNETMNKWLLEQFGTTLYLADGYAECSCDSLNSQIKEEAALEPGESLYEQMFHGVFSTISKKKMQRYSAKQLQMMNRIQGSPLDEYAQIGRECSVCGNTAKLVTEDRCEWCERFAKMSWEILNDNYLIISDEQPVGTYFKVPAFEGERFVSFAETTVQKEKRVRLYYKFEYRKNPAEEQEQIRASRLANSNKLYVVDYIAESSMEKLAEASGGIEKIAVCRLDVDDLGEAFVSGFERKDAKTLAERRHFVTISRTASFSRQMSLFFKCYIKPVLSGDYEIEKDLLVKERDGKGLKVAVVYSGGDDVFLVGGWDEVVNAAHRIRVAFEQFTGGTLTLSAGIGMYNPKFPIRLAADQTALLEEEAKNAENKNSITLFEPNAHSTFTWNEFEEDVVGEKLKLLNEFLQGEEQERGNTFLYHLMELLVEMQEHGKGIQLARYAYLLARMEPSKDSSNYKLYANFSKQMYAWATSGEKVRKALIMAVKIYFYLNRERGGTSENE